MSADASQLHAVIASARRAKAGGFGVMSTGEKLAAALLLNRKDWLDEMNYTMAQAIDRLGPEWLSQIPQANRILEDEADAA